MSQKNYTLQEIARTVEATFLCCADENESISHILLDSRQVHTGSGTLFFAIEGIQHDGHDFIPTLIESGIRNFVVSKNLKINKKLGSVLNVLKVDDSIKALQKLAAFHRSQFTFPLIGITGSNGKTIVKEWLFQLLDKRYNIVRSPKSYNSQIGVPLSVWQIKPEHSLGIIEAGISKPGEMERLEKVIRPDIGILTNIGYAHAEGFQNSKQKLREKLHLFANSEVLICPADDPLIQDVVEEFKQERKKSLKKPLLIFNWGKSAKASVKIGQIKTENTRTAIALKHNGNNYQFNIPFSDKASIENAISCATCGIYLQAADEVFLKSFEQLSTVAMRLELKDAVNQCSLINDSYNSDLGSLKIALDFLKQQQQHSKRTLILSDILQSGMSDKTLLNEVVRLVKDSDLQKFIGIGPVLYKNRDLFNELKAAQFFYKDTTAFLNAIQQLSFYDESILLKGARDFHFEKISRLLERKFHETVFEINLNAVSHNLAAVRNHLGDKTKIMAMVKAFSYGSGAFEIANMLQFQHVDYLSVAFVDEGIALRNAGITLPVMVMNPEENSFESLLHYKLEPEIYSFRLLRKFSALLDNKMPEEKLPIHIKIDTGMHRLGFLPHEIDVLAREIKNQKSWKVASVFSHLSSSEDPQDDAFTEQQIEKFKKAAGQLESLLGYSTLKHLLNSAGTLRFPQGKFDMVRVGLVLYGIDMTGVLANQLEPVGQLKTSISQIKTLEKGASVGYNRKAKADKKLRVATIAIGYADGYRRAFGNKKAHVLVRDKKAAVIGNVCMDMCMIDVTHIPEASEGDEVLLFGKELPVEILAKWAETIPYEILTGIGERVKRVYFKE